MAIYISISILHEYMYGHQIYTRISENMNVLIFKDWRKHWFVLSGSALKYYRDSQAEAEKAPDGVVDISRCVDVVTAEVSKNYGFILKVWNRLKYKINTQCT